MPSIRRQSILRSGLRGPLFLVAVLFAVWLTTVVSVIARTDRDPDLNIGNGVIELSWGGINPDVKELYRRAKTASLLYDLENGSPDPRPICGSYLGFYAPPSRKFSVFVATWPALGNINFWTPDRLGLRFPRIHRDWSGITTAQFPTVLPVVTVLAWCLIRHKKGNPIASGHCPACRYDLTGNTSGKCPECGEKVTLAPPTVESTILAGR